MLLFKFSVSTKAGGSKGCFSARLVHVELEDPRGFRPAGRGVSRPCVGATIMPVWRHPILFGGSLLCEGEYLLCTAWAVVVSEREFRGG